MHVHVSVAIFNFYHFQFFYLLTNSSEEHEFIIESYKQPFFILYPYTHPTTSNLFLVRVRSVRVSVGVCHLLPHAINTSSKCE